MMKSIEPPIGIIITMPEKFFQDTEYSYEGFSRDFEKVLEREDENGIWNFRLKNLPVQDFLYVYIVFDGKVQYRTNLLDMERNVSKRFGDNGKIRSFQPCNWLRLIGPVRKAPKDISMRGFQGFRYLYQEIF